MKKISIFLSAFFLLLINSCTNLISLGTINFFLEERASFVDPNYSTNSISGERRTVIVNGLPKLKKESYFFVGWREYINGQYSMIQTKIITDYN